MENREWEKFGEEICRNVQNAIDSHDYSMLNRTISDTVNGAVDYFSHTVRNVGNTVNENIRMQQGMAEDASGMAAHSKKTPALYGMTGPTKAGGTALSIIGYGAGAISLLAAILIMVAGIASGYYGSGYWAGLILTGIPMTAFFIMAAIGGRMRGRVRRFREYVRILGGREYCDVKELQEQCGAKKSKKFVVQDLERMIQKGWFKEGHLDSKKSCLMISHKAYRQYTDLMNRVEMEEREKKQKAREEEAQRKAQEAAAQENQKLPPKVREAIQAGEEYIRKIRACNDAIPGEEISAKISRIEMLVDRIFDRVEQNPASVSDLRRMMEYYLPTTVKLLEAYEDLDSQPVQGENIISSKKEIEKTLDTLNVAFEKLLDSLFQDTAWDVSSDISVLHTMLAQEGLTEDGLKK